MEFLLANVFLPVVVIAMTIEPVDLTDSEVIDWLNEYCDRLEYRAPTSSVLGCFIVHNLWIGETKGQTIREAVCLAAAIYDSINR